MTATSPTRTATSTGALPDEEFFGFINDLMRPVGTYLYGRRLVVGGGKQFLPDRVRLRLELLDARRFGSGVVYLRYRTQT